MGQTPKVVSKFYFLNTDINKVCTYICHKNKEAAANARHGNKTNSAQQAK